MAPTSITEELKQTRPFHSASQEASVALMRTAHLLRRRVEALVSTEGITSQQYNVLRILRGARSPMPTMEISSRMIEPACGITRLIVALEQAGFVKREQWPGDRRQMLCQITPAGLRVLERLEEPLNQLEGSFASSFNADEIATLLSLLARVRDQLRD